MRHGAFARRRQGTRGGEGVRAAAADVMLILGDIGEVREKAEGADQLQRLIARQGVERALQLLARGAVLVAAETNRTPADTLDRLERGVALLLAHRVAEDATEETNVLAQRQILLFAVPGLGDRHGGLLRH